MAEDYRELELLETPNGVYNSFPDKLARNELKGKVPVPDKPVEGYYLKIKAVNGDGTFTVEAVPAPTGGGELPTTAKFETLYIGAEGAGCVYIQIDGTAEAPTLDLHGENDDEAVRLRNLARAVDDSDAPTLAQVREIVGNGSEDWSHLTGYLMGDSLTDPAGGVHTSKFYYEYIQELTGVQWIVDGIGGTGYYAGASTGTRFADRVKNIPEGVDFVICFGSGNDVAYATQEQYHTAMAETMAYFYENRPGLPVIIVPPSPWATYSKRSDEWKNYCDTMELVALNYSLHYVGKMWTAPPFDPNSPADREAFFTKCPDGVHPDENGHRLLAPYFYNAMLEVLALEGKCQAGGDSGENLDYSTATNKPSINGVTLEGNKTAEELGIGQPSDEQVGAAVGDWLEAHPEATTVVADGSITAQKTTFITPEADNLIDMSKVVKGYQGAGGVPAGGSLPNTTTGCTTDYIEVEPGATYNSVGGHGTSGIWSSWFYDADKNPVSVVPATPFAVPEGAAYVRLTFANNADISTLQLGLYRGENPMVYTQGTQRYKLDSLLTQAVKNVLDANSVFKVTQKNLYKLAADGTMDGATGRFTLSGGSLNISDYIEVTPGVWYISNCFAAPSFSACYDADREYVSAFGDAAELGTVVHDGGTYWTFKITNPNVRYIVNGAAKTLGTPVNTPFIVRGNAMPDSLDGIDISTPDMAFVEAARKLLGVGGGKLAGKVLAGMGNSITAATAVEHGYLSRIADKMGATAINYGVNGSWVSYNEAMAGQEMCTRYADMTDDADYVTVKGGINDINNHAPLGALGDTEKTTFYGALDILCQGLLEKYPGKKIAYITPLYYGNSDTAGQYIKAIFEVCNQYGIPVIDMYHSGPFSAAVPAEIRALYFYDGLHPNDYGHEVMARYIGQQLECL